MNAERRKELEKLKEETTALQSKVNDLRTQVDSIMGEEQDYFDNMPEGLQGGEKGEKAQAAITALEEIESRLGDIEGSFDEIGDKIDEASE